jgi:predicted ATPase
VPPRRRNSGLSHALEHLILNLLHRSPQERISNASTVRRALMNLDPQLRPSPLLGRDALFEQLQHHLERVAQGQGGLVVIQGPRGIGKSRLISSVAEEWAADQALIPLYGQLFKYKQTGPYELFITALRPILRDLPAHELSQLLSQLGDLSNPLMALIPDLRPTLSGYGRSDTDCTRLEEAICETFRLLSEANTLLLILDSLQWIDAASLRLLDRLVRLRIPRLLIAALHRSEEIGHDHPLHQTLNALEPWVDERLDVKGLEPIDIYQMTAPINTQAPPDFGLWLYGETKGNPLHTDQLIEAYLEGPSDTRPPHERTTSTLEDIILRRLERLPGPTLLALRQAAVLGQTFYLDHLRAALDRPVSQVLSSLESAIQANFVFGHVSEDRFGFRHPVIREVLYSEMLGGVRMRYHWQAAQVLERGGIAGVLDNKIDLLAYQFSNAGEYEKALVYLARATRRAKQLCANDVALNYIDQALDLVKHLSQSATTNEEREQRRKQRDDLLDARARLETTVPASLESGP